MQPNWGPRRWKVHLAKGDALATADAWEAAAGPPCPVCGEPMLRVQDGLCPRCARKRQELQERERLAADQLLRQAGHLFSARSRARLRRIARGERI